MERLKSPGNGENPSKSCERIAYSIADAAKAVGLGRTTLYALIGEGRLQSLKIGNRRLIRKEALLALIDQPLADNGQLK